VGRGRDADSAEGDVLCVRLLDLLWILLRELCDVGGFLFGEELTRRRVVRELSLCSSLWLLTVLLAELCRLLTHGKSLVGCSHRLQDSIF
jgi:hypothetical protein